MCHLRVSHFTFFVEFFSALDDLGCIFSQKKHSTSYFCNKILFRVSETQKPIFFTVFLCFENFSLAASLTYLAESSLSLKLFTNSYNIFLKR